MSPGPVEPVKKSPQHSTLFHYHDETDDTPVAADLSDSRLADSCSPSNIDTRPPAELPAQVKRQFIHTLCTTHVLSVLACPG